MQQRRHEGDQFFISLGLKEKKEQIESISRRGEDDLYGEKGKGKRTSLFG